MTKHVTNTMMKQKNVKIEFASWGEHAVFMSEREGDVRLDAVQVAPSADGQSVKLTTVDITHITVATPAESELLHEKMAPRQERPRDRHLQHQQHSHDEDQKQQHHNDCRNFG